MLIKDIDKASFKPVKVIPENLPSQTFLRETGIEDRSELFKIIDKNFKQLTLQKIPLVKKNENLN